MLKTLRNFLATLLIGAASIPASATPRTFFDLNATDIDGSPSPLEKYRGQVVLVVNTASKCGFTGQYEDLEKIYLKYKDSGCGLWLWHGSFSFGSKVSGDRPLGGCFV